MPLGSFRLNTLARSIVSEIVIDPVPIASGGTVSIIEQNGINYAVHAFTAVGTSTFSTPQSLDIEILIVGGGGVGGDSAGGGGGAGALWLNNYTIGSGNYTATVGDGAKRNGFQQGDILGGSSRFQGTGLDIVVAGGGRGGGHNTGNAGIRNGRNGGSGGGGSMNYNGVRPANGVRVNNGATVNGQGFAAGNAGAPGGANTADNPRNTGGGGGATQAGTFGAGTFQRPNGGAGRYVAWAELAGYGASGGSNSAGWFAGGGGGARSFNDRASAGFGFGGLGGGGNGGNPGEATSGLPNTGSGGGGGGGAAGEGGSGIILIRYPV